MRKKVHVLQRYTHERVAIMLLPNYPFSGQPKADLEHDLAVCKRNKKKIAWLATFSWLWMVFAAVAPVYLILIMDQVEQEADGVDSVWIMYSIIVGVVIPFNAITINTLIWKSYYHWLTKGGKILEEGERRDGSTLGWFAKDSESEYEPPSAQPSRDVD